MLLAAAPVATIGAHQLLVLLLQIGVLLGLALVLGRVATRLGWPAVVGELTAGLLLGPSLLAHVAPGVSAWLLPPNAAQQNLLDAVAQLGVLLLVAVTGLHVDLDLGDGDQEDAEDEQADGRGPELLREEEAGGEQRGPADEADPADAGEEARAAREGGQDGRREGGVVKVDRGEKDDGLGEAGERIAVARGNKMDTADHGEEESRHKNTGEQAAPRQFDDGDCDRGAV